MSGQLHAPAASPWGKEPPVPIGQEAGWVPESVWTWCQRENFQPPSGFENQSSNCPACSQSLYWLSYPSCSSRRWAPQNQSPWSSRFGVLHGLVTYLCKITELVSSIKIFLKSQHRVLRTRNIVLFVFSTLHMIIFWYNF